MYFGYTLRLRYHPITVGPKFLYNFSCGRYKIKTVDPNEFPVEHERGISCCKGFYEKVTKPNRNLKDLNYRSTLKAFEVFSRPRHCHLRHPEVSSPQIYNHNIMQLTDLAACLTCLQKLLRLSEQFFKIQFFLLFQKRRMVFGRRQKHLKGSQHGEKFASITNCFGTVYKN